MAAVAAVALAGCTLVDPFGGVHPLTITTAADGSVSITGDGWAFDPDQPAEAIQVAVLVGDTEVGRFPTTHTRADSDNPFERARSFRIAVTIDAPTAASMAGRPIHVVALNAGDGANHDLAPTCPETLVVGPPGSFSTCSEPLGALPAPS